MHEIHRILTEARDLVAKGHTKGCFARDATGTRCLTSDPAATHFCLQGAILRAQRCFTANIHTRVFARVEGNTVNWNDAPERTQGEVVALLNRVIFEEGGMSEAEYILRQARQRCEAGWRRGVYASSDKGTVHVQDPTAKYFCTLGAVHASLPPHDGNGDLAMYAMIEGMRKAFPKGITVWNDTLGRTKEEVLAQFDRWIDEAHGDKYWGLT